MPVTFVQPAAEIQRDGYGRPLVLPTTGEKKRVPYTRCTTFVAAIEERFNLERWAERKLAVGLGLRPDLQIEVALATPDAETQRGKQVLDALCEQAKEAAGSKVQAAIGTAMHKLTERHDLGLPMDDVPVPIDYVADLAAYVEATAPLKMIEIEHGVVLDTLQIHGTPDRVVEYQGQRYIADLKTGSLDYSIGTIAQQLAVYARSALYDDLTGQRTPHGASTERGLILHLPAGKGICNLVWVDLRAGWDGVQLCSVVRQHRKLTTSKALTVPGLDAVSTPFAGIARTDPLPIDNLKAAIDGATDRHDLDRLWAQHAKSFTPEHIAAAKAKAASFQTAAA